MAVLASPRRSEILRLVWDRELAAGDIHRAMPDVTFGAISLQLRQLAEAGLVEVRAESRNRYYRARKETAGELGQILERMWSSALWRLKLAAELEEGRRGPRPGRRTTNS
ncbi:MAG TPA: helix-turn-helix domain-containing protein, partial [Longimicrobiales bacterium]